MEVLNTPLPPGDYAFHFALDRRVDNRAPAAMFSRDVFLLDELSLEGESAPPSGFQQLPHWQTAVPNWLDSVEIRVE